jgi:hypothetical protein
MEGTKMQKRFIMKHKKKHILCKIRCQECTHLFAVVRGKLKAMILA